VGAVDGAIEAPQVAVDEAGLVQVQQQGIEDFGPGAVLAPAVEAVVDGLPRAIALGSVGPGGAGMQVPKYTVNEAPMLLRFLADHGFALGVPVRVVSTDPGAGALTVEVGGTRRVAMSLN